MLFKKCSKCNNEKSINEFWKDKRKKDGYDNQCIVCAKEVQKRSYLKNFEKYKFKKEIWAANNPEKVLAYQIKWQKNNPDKVKEMQKTWKENNPNKVEEYNQKAKQRYRNYKLEHPKVIKVRVPDLEKIREQRRRSDKKRMLIPSYKLGKNFSHAIRYSLKGNKCGRYWKTLVNYSLQELITHLEKQFRIGMSWDNYGKAGWEIDHIIPKSLWEYESPEDAEFKQCWSLENLQPLWAKENLIKGNKIMVAS